MVYIYIYIYIYSISSYTAVNHIVHFISCMYVNVIDVSGKLVMNVVIPTVDCQSASGFQYVMDERRNAHTDNEMPYSIVHTHTWVKMP